MPATTASTASPTWPTPTSSRSSPGRAGGRRARCSRASRPSSVAPIAGFPGDDDAGATSAVYVFGAMGFCPVTPGLPEYRLGSPLFDKIVLHLDPKYASGGTFTIEARPNSAASLYVQSATLHGQPWREARLPHEVVLKGGSLVLLMGATR